MIYIFDICDTLYQSNTTFDFIDFYLAETRQSAKRVFLKSVRWKYSPVFLLLLLLGRITKSDWHKTVSLLLLKGEKAENLDRYANSFFDKVLNSKCITATHQILQEAKLAGNKIYLVSSTIEPVAKAIAVRLGVEFFSSELKLESGIFTGMLANDITGQKEKVLKQFLGEISYSVVTDNISDYKLVAAAEHKYVVIQNQKHIKNWKALNPVLIFPNQC